MLNNKEVILEEKECAEMLGMSVKKYRESLKKVKAPAKENISDDKIKYDNSVLNFLGIKESDLKKRCIM